MKTRRYTLPYWVKQHRGYDCDDAMASAVQHYIEHGDHPEMAFTGTALELANALYTESRKRIQPALGAYFTPPDVAARMADSLRLTPSMVVLDPCAGIGNLMHAVIERGAYTVGWELQFRLAHLAQILGYAVTIGNGLAVDTVAPDAVIINPPFGNMQGHADIAVEFMRGAAAYGVPVAAILPRGWLTQARKSHREVATLYDVVDSEDLPAATFAPLTSIVTTRYLLLPRGESIQ